MNQPFLRETIGEDSDDAATAPDALGAHIWWLLTDATVPGTRCVISVYKLHPGVGHLRYPHHHTDQVPCLARGSEQPPSLPLTSAPAVASRRPAAPSSQPSTVQQPFSSTTSVPRNQRFTDITGTQWQRCIRAQPVQPPSHLPRDAFRNATTCRTKPQPSAAGGSCVVNVASDLPKQPEPIPADHSAMKAALLYLAKALAAEQAPHGCRSAVCPGPVGTSVWTWPGGVADALAATCCTDRDTAVQRYLRDRHMPLGMAQPADVAASIAYLGNPDSARIIRTSIDIARTTRKLIRDHNEQSTQTTSGAAR